MFQNKKRLYDHKEYEDFMFHFNTETRTTYYEHDIHGAGLDHCFDCASEVLILGLYLHKFRAMKEGSVELKQEISRMSERLSSAISNKGRTLKIVGSY